MSNSDRVIDDIHSFEHRHHEHHGHVHVLGVKRCLGAKRSSLRVGSFRHASATLVTSRPLPVSFDCSRDLVPVRDQGDRPICAAVTGATILEFKTFKRLQKKVYLEPESIYAHRQDQNEEGMSGQDLGNVMHIHGCSTVATYQDAILNPGDAGKTQNMVDDALKHRVDHPILINSVEEAKHALIQHGPLATTLPCYSAGLSFWRPNNASEDCLGGHCVTMTGFDETGFKLRNSWSKRWGDKGYTHFKYEDWVHCWELWAFANDNEEPPKLSAPEQHKEQEVEQKQEEPQEQKQEVEEKTKAFCKPACTIL